MLGLVAIRRPGPTLSGTGVVLRPPRTSDFDEWARLRGDSRGFLEPWEPKWAPDELSRAAWRDRLRRYRREFEAGQSLPFFVFERATGRLAGGITISGIKRGVAQSASIGYWMGERFAGRGMMVEAVRLVGGYCFEQLRLHRIEAACIPGNQRSMRVLEKAGFNREGLLRSYLKINGTWQDHVLYSLIAGEQPENDVRGP